MAEFYSTWASSQYLTEDFNLPFIPLSDNSLRQIIHTSIGGNSIRIRFSNKVGDADLEIKSVNIAKSKAQGSGTIILQTEKSVLFNNKNEITIKQGQEVYSDILDFDFEPLEELTISIFFGKVPQKVTGHPGSRTFSYLEKGNQISKETFSHDYKTAHWYVLAGIEVYSEKPASAIICLGDSITDGRGSTDDKQNRWTDNLSEKIQNDSTLPKNIAVINQGIGGTCIIGSGTSRFQSDVLDQKGIKYIVLLYGINDIIYANRTAADLIQCYKDFIQKAHSNNIKIYGGTILPCGNFGEYTEEKNKIRLETNKWIRESTSTDEGFDAVIDFDKFMRSEENPDKLEKIYDCGDGLHPSAEGYRRMAEAFTDLSLFNK